MTLTDYVAHEGDVSLVGYRDPQEYWGNSYWDIRLNESTIISVSDDDLDDYIKFFKKLKKKSQDE